MKTIGPRERSAILLARYVHLGQIGGAEAAAFHARMRGVSARDIRSLLAGGVPDDRDLAALVAATWLVLDSKGRLANDDVEDLREAGVERINLLEVIALVGAEFEPAGV